MSEKLTHEECWEFLRAHEFGRLAFHLSGEVHITPINYAVDEETLLFRTGQGNKLLGIVMSDDVAFEIDDFSGDHAWSVVVRGKARRLEGQEIYRAEHVGVRPWVGQDKHEVVEITPTGITGRAFDVSRPWQHIIPTP